MSVVSHPFHKRPEYRNGPAHTAPMQHLEDKEDQFLREVLAMETAGSLPLALSNPVHRYLRALREQRTHSRGGMVLSHGEYAEVSASIPVLREQIIATWQRLELLRNRPH